MLLEIGFSLPLQRAMLKLQSGPARSLLVSHELLHSLPEEHVCLEFELSEFYPFHADGPSSDNFELIMSMMAVAAHLITLFLGLMDVCKCAERRHSFIASSVLLFQYY
jgi:hypothetical protein